MSENQLLTYSDVAKLLKLSPATLRVWVMQKRIPHIKCGGYAVRFRESDIEKFIESQIVDSSA